LLRKTSLVDFPGKVSSVFFFSGCNLRCPWCHNPDLVTGGAQGLIDPDTALAHIRKRRSVLGGVVLSGGEPCLHGELPEIIAEIKKLSLPVKLDTNGTVPDMLEKLIGSDETRPDYIALDLKIAPSRYAEIAVTPGQAPGDNLIKSAAIIRQSGIAHEYRTLALPSNHITGEDIEALIPLVDNAPWHFRLFRGGNCLDPAWDNLEENAAKAREKAESLALNAREFGNNDNIRLFAENEKAGK
jgi:pyruvate formate lyase activating enzyme